MPGGELEPIARSGPALAEVAVEMSEIFARAGLGSAAPGLRRPTAVAALRPSRGGNWATTLMVAATAGLVGLGAGALVLRGPSTPTPVEARVAPQVQPPVKPQPATTPPVALAQAAPAPAPEVAPAREPTPARSAQAAAARSRAQFRMKLARLGDPAPAQARPPIRLREPTPAAQSASCEQEATGGGCRRAVIQADRHLRAVYESAIRRGVSRSTLVDYRDRWADLRERDTDDPSRLIQSYGSLAYDLGRESAGPDDQDATLRPRSRSGLRALADLLLPWR